MYKLCCIQNIITLLLLFFIVIMYANYIVYGVLFAHDYSYALIMYDYTDKSCIYTVIAYD